VTRHFLYLTNTRLVSLVTQRGRIMGRREFAVSGAGAAEFERYLAQFAEVPTRLFTDLAEEDIRLDTIPHVGARDREAILQRKLAQIFRSTPYRHAKLQGREADGRRDDRVIYTAVTNAEVLKPWVDVIERLHVPLAGIHSSAVFSSVVLEELDLVFPHTLLVTFTPGGALRQTYFRDREIRFSRLTPLDLEEGQTMGQMVSEETTRTWQYLDSLRNFGPEDRLEVCILVHQNERADLQQHLRDFAQIQYRVLDIELVSTKLGLKPAPLDSTAEEVIVHLYLMRPVSNHFASGEQMRHADRRRARLTLHQVAAGILVASLAWGGWNLTRVFRASHADQQVVRQISALNREYDEITKSLPSFGVGGSTMRDVVSFYNGSIRPFPVFGEFLVPLSGALQAHPQVRLSQIAWLATDDPKANPPLPPGGGGGGRAPTPVKSIAKGDGPALPPPAAEDPNPPFAGGRYEVALLEATVRVQPNDYRGALAEVERLAADISRQGGYRAEVVDSPFDMRSSLMIQGRLGERDVAVMEPRFVLRIVRERRSA
jgi:hypothetical protein